MLILCRKMVPRGMIHCLFWKKQASLWPLTLLLCRLRDRVTVKTGPRHIVRETDNSTFEMIIKSAVRSDAGIYICKIINEYGTKQCEGKLQVQGMLLSRFLCTVATTLCLLSSAGCGSWVVLLTYILSNALSSISWACSGCYPPVEGHYCQGWRDSSIWVSHPRTKRHWCGLAHRWETDPASTAQLQDALWWKKVSTFA